MFFTESKSNPTRSNYLTLIALSAIAVLLFLAWPGKASAAEATAGDTVTIPLGGKGKGLRAKGARVTPVSPATIRGATVVLPVSTITVPLLNEGTLVLRGGFVVKSGKRKVTVQGLLLTLRGGKVTATGKVGSRRVTIFTGSSAGSLIDAATTSVTAISSKLSLTPAGAKQLNKALRSRAFKRAALGRLSGTAKAKPQSSTAPPPGGGTPNSDFNWTEPPVLSQPSGAVPATSSPLTVWPRVSFINYLRMGGGGANSEGPASDGSAINPIDHICPDDAPASAGVFSFNMPFSSGWWHAASNTGAFYFSGTIRFTYPDHGINIAITDAEVEFNGASSRVIYKISDPDNLAGKRGDLVTLPGLASTNPVPGVLAEYEADVSTVGNQALGGLYTIGSPFGCIEMNFSA